MAYEFGRIKIKELDAIYVGLDTSLVMYLASIYFGMGRLLLLNTQEVVNFRDSAYTSKWQYKCPLKDEVLTYAFAKYVKWINGDIDQAFEGLPDKITEMKDEVIKILNS